jgi:hypothetical protein
LTLARPAALLLTAAVMTACVGTAGAAGPSATPAPDPDRVVFRVDWDGGFVPPGVHLGRLPQVVVYADGRVVMPGPQVEIFPAPVLPALQARTLTPEALARLIALAKDLDLLADAHYDAIGIADAPTTILTLDIGGETYRVSAYALAEADTDDAAGFPGMDETTKAARASLQTFIDTLTGLPDGDFTGPWATYEATSLRIFTVPMIDVPDDMVPPGGPVAWPIGVIDTAGEPVGDGALGIRCQVVTGGDLDTLAPSLQEANAQTLFTSGGGSWSLVVRPLLPGEAGC